MNPLIKAGIYQRERAAKCAEFASAAHNTEIAGMLLPQEIHEWCRELIRRPEKRLSYRREWTFDSILDALDYVERNIDAEKNCILFGYDLNTDISLLMPKPLAFAALRKRNTLLSLDGVIISNVNITSSYVLDYEDADNERCLSRVFCSVVGEIGLGSNFPGTRE